VADGCDAEGWVLRAALGDHQQDRSLERGLAAALLDRNDLVRAATEHELYVGASVGFDFRARLRAKHDFVRAVELPAFGASAHIVGQNELRHAVAGSDDQVREIGVDGLSGGRSGNGERPFDEPQATGKIARERIEAAIGAYLSMRKILRGTVPRSRRGSFRVRVSRRPHDGSPAPTGSLRYSDCTYFCSRRSAVSSSIGNAKRRSFEAPPFSFARPDLNRRCRRRPQNPYRSAHPLGTRCRRHPSSRR